MPAWRRPKTLGDMTTTTALSTPTLFTRAFVLLAAADLAYFTADGIAIYALPLYVTGPVGSDEAGAGLAFGAFAVSALVLRPFAGRLCDTRGRRPLLLTGAALCVVGMVLTALVGSLTHVVAARLLLGVGEAAFFVASITALVDIAPPERLGEAMSYNSLGLYLGLSLGPPLGEMLVNQRGFVAAWLGAASLGLVSVLTVLRLPETRVTSPDASRAPLIHWKAVPIALGFLTSIVAMGGFLAFASLHAAEVGLRAASLPLFTYGAVVVVGRISFARVVDRVPSLPLGAAALTAMAAGLIVVASWSSPVGVVVGAVLLGIGVTFSTPAFFSAIFAAVRPSERGAASGTATAFIDLGLGGGPIVLGLIASAATIPLAFVVAAAVALLGAVWTLSLRRGSPRTA